mgnify:FL=1
MANCTFIDGTGSFELKGAQRCSGLYFLLAGEYGMKSSLTPNLAGDAKLDQNPFLLPPVSIENLHNDRSNRNFWCIVEQKSAWSVTGQSAAQEAKKFTEEEEAVTVRAGYMWHQTSRISRQFGLTGSITSYIPIQKNIEVHIITITNQNKTDVTFVPVAAFPIYGRSADNIRDHRHVTSLLHRITVTDRGVNVCPTLSFDERGHQLNDTMYFVEGITENGEAPCSFYPEIAEFIGEGGNLEAPEAVIKNLDGVTKGTQRSGQEAFGGLRFARTTLGAGESKSYIIFAGTGHSRSEIRKLLADYPTLQEVQDEFVRVKQYWKNKVNVSYHTGDEVFDQFMNWVSFQPELRRLFGCSFLPHHDYGKGGGGWRDPWQDCLALLLMNPGGVRQMLLGNFAGVRMDGSNATIIGEHVGEFKADRNSITRVWMDHGVWPLITTKRYIDQTGDLDLLEQPVRYFKDGQIMRGTDTDEQIAAIVKSSETYLYDESCGGYRLNTDFGEVKTDMGRMFGFAYGEKENGAVFSHMAVMFANALYQRGYAKEGHKALHSLYMQSMDFEKSHIYPGIPEYFGRNGRGLYHYLTGAASWYMMTVVNQMFGIRGCLGELLVEPKLLAEQFDEDGFASLTFRFQGMGWHAIFENSERKDYGQYHITRVCLDDKQVLTQESGSVVLKRELLAKLDTNITHKISVKLN